MATINDLPAEIVAVILDEYIQAPVQCAIATRTQVHSKTYIDDRCCWFKTRVSLEKFIAAWRILIAAQTDIDMLYTSTDCVTIVVKQQSTCTRYYTFSMRKHSGDIKTYHKHDGGSTYGQHDNTVPDAIQVFARDIACASNKQLPSFTYIRDVGAMSRPVYDVLWRLMRKHYGPGERLRLMI